MDLPDLQGKKVVVTGAGAGIGRALCIRLHSQGLQVYALSKTLKNLESLLVLNAVCTAARQKPR